MLEQRSRRREKVKEGRVRQERWKIKWSRARQGRQGDLGRRDGELESRAGEEEGRTEHSGIRFPHNVITAGQEVLLEKRSQLSGNELLILKGLLQALMLLQQCCHLVLEGIHCVHQAPAGQGLFIHVILNTHA